jgi:hypothetical protein
MSQELAALKAKHERIRDELIDVLNRINTLTQEQGDDT